MFDYTQLTTAINDVPDDVLEVFQKTVLNPSNLDMDWVHVPFITNDYHLNIILNVEIIVPKDLAVDEVEVIKLLLDFSHDTNQNIKGYLEAIKQLITNKKHLIYDSSVRYEELYEDLAGDIKNVDVASERASDKTPEPETVQERLQEEYPHLKFMIESGRLYILTTNQHQVEDVLKTTEEILDDFRDNN